MAQSDVKVDVLGERERGERDPRFVVTIFIFDDVKYVKNRY